MYILAWTLCVFPTEANWFRQARNYPAHVFKRLRHVNTLGTSHRVAASADDGALAGTISSPSQGYTFSLPNAIMIEPTLTSQGMIVSSIIPLYEVCDVPLLQRFRCEDILEVHCILPPDSNLI